MVVAVGGLLDATAPLSFSDSRRRRSPNPFFSFSFPLLVSGGKAHFTAIKRCKFEKERRRGERAVVWREWEKRVVQRSTTTCYFSGGLHESSNLSNFYKGYGNVLLKLILPPEKRKTMSYVGFANVELTCTQKGSNDDN